jgi:hypothetical protein
MTCECANRLNKDKNIYNKPVNNKLVNSKTLGLEDMKNMSIYEITNLYKDGYTADSITNS